MAGIDTVGVELDGNARMTRKQAGLDEWPTVPDIEKHDINKHNVEKNDPCGVAFEKRNVLVGGPPCQTFTVLAPVPVVSSFMTCVRQ